MVQWWLVRKESAKVQDVYDENVQATPNRVHYSGYSQKTTCSSTDFRSSGFYRQL